MGEHRNLFLAIGLSAIILLGYQFLVLGPQAERQRAERAAELAQQAMEQQDGELAEGLTDGLTQAADTRPTGFNPNGARIDIDATDVVGSFALTGARLDDLRLRQYAVAVDDETRVTLLSPEGLDNAYFARDGWSRVEGSQLFDITRADSEWEIISGDTLTETTPVVIGFTADGIEIRRTLTIDEHYMVTYEDTVTNTTDSPISLARFGEVRRYGVPEYFQNFFILHEGQIGVVDGRRHQVKYNNIDAGDEETWIGNGGWMGITDKYWLAAAIPDQTVRFGGEFSASSENGELVITSRYVTQPIALQPGSSHSSTSRVFAGAKEVDVLQAYQSDLEIEHFDLAVDWGNFWFLTRPYFILLNFFSGWLGGIGAAILAVTVLVKLIFFPIANRAYASMAKMKAVQPKVQEIRERFASDQQKQQQAMMELYRNEKINPVAGCLPILIQIPIFYALYKTLFVTLEMRHQPFVGWINDLAAPDPTTIWNIFGLIPWDPSGVWLIGGFLAVGLWPILMAVSMAAQQALNPPPPDPMQARIFAFLPWVFMFMLANFPAGLVIYWTWNNLLSVGQQYVIMRRHGNETQLDKLIARLRNGSKGDES